MQFREMTAWHAWIEVMLVMVIKVQIVKQENINFYLAMRADASRGYLTWHGYVLCETSQLREE